MLWSVAFVPFFLLLIRSRTHAVELCRIHGSIDNELSDPTSLPTPNLVVFFC